MKRNQPENKTKYTVVEKTHLQQTKVRDKEDMETVRFLKQKRTPPPPPPQKKKKKKKKKKHVRSGSSIPEHSASTRVQVS